MIMFALAFLITCFAYVIVITGFFLVIGVAFFLVGNAIVRIVDFLFGEERV